MSESKGQHEPSMEEILASIRRIIAEDGEQPAANASAAAPSAAQPESATKGEEILELTEVVQEERASPDPPEPVLTPGASVLDTLSPAPATDPNRLVSDAVAAASLAALSQIHQLGSRNEKRMSDIPLGEGQRTIENMVREMLRPLLKEWLDSNLPHLVERVVQEEVSRLVRDVQRR